VVGTLIPLDAEEGAEFTYALVDEDTYPDNLMDISAAPLINGTTYYWQARANQYGLWGQWTPSASFV